MKIFQSLEEVMSVQLRLADSVLGVGRVASSDMETVPSPIASAFDEIDEAIIQGMTEAARQLRTFAV